MSAFVLLEVEGFQVVGDEDGTLVVLGGLGGVGGSAGVEVGVLGVVEDEVLYAKFLGQHACIEGRTVAFLVGVKDEAVLIEAEGLAHQPITVAGIGFALHGVRFVTEAHEALPVRQLGLEAILFDLGRCDVKEGDLHVIDVHRFAVAHLAQNDGLADGIEDFTRNHEFAHRVERVAHHVVAVDGEGSLVLALENHGRNLAHHPDGSQDVVGVGVGNKHVTDALKGYPRRNELAQDAVAATAVYKHSATGRMQVEAGVIAVDAHGITRAEHGDA